MCRSHSWAVKRVLNMICGYMRGGGSFEERCEWNVGRWKKRLEDMLALMVLRMKWPQKNTADIKRVAAVSCSKGVSMRWIWDILWGVLDLDKIICCLCADSGENLLRQTAVCWFSVKWDRCGCGKGSVEVWMKLREKRKAWIDWRVWCRYKNCQKRPWCV